MVKKDKKPSSETRNLRIQQIIFIIFGVIIILSMVLALVAK